MDSEKKSDAEPEGTTHTPVPATAPPVSAIASLEMNVDEPAPVLYTDVAKEKDMDQASPEQHVGEECSDTGQVSSECTGEEDFVQKQSGGPFRSPTLEDEMDHSCPVVERTAEAVPDVKETDPEKSFQPTSRPPPPPLPMSKEKWKKVIESRFNILL